jgi:spore coat polysaccharide biosynthesis predicted glycosyltransferase SpsG
MRLLAIAEEIISDGHEAIFVGMVSEIKWLWQTVKEIGFLNIHPTGENYSPNFLSDILIIDSYTIDPNDKFIASENWKFIMVICDEYTPSYKCNLRIHPGLSIDWNYNHKTPIYFGNQLIPIRRSIMNKKYKPLVGLKGLKILITAGATNNSKLYSALHQTLKEFKEVRQIYFLSDNILKFKSDSKFKIINLGKNFDKYIFLSDLIICSASSTALECISLGIPTGIIQTSENQKNNYREITRLALASPIGEIKEGLIYLNFDSISRIIKSQTYRSELSKRGKNTISQTGVRNIIRLLFEHIYDLK